MIEVGTAPDPGSFRDPLSRVYIDDDAVWRGLSEAGLADFEAYAATQAFAAAQERRPGRRHHGGAGRRGTRGRRAGRARFATNGCRVITYPYEWTFSMLKDAALLQLELSREALAEGILTKDATSYNVQFEGARPVFIDVGSFERLVPGEPWPGYRQFCELFLNPLYLQAVVDVPFQPWLRGSVHGISPTIAAHAIGSRGRLRRDLLTHVRLHARAEARYADADADRDVKGELQRGRVRSEADRRADGQPPQGGGAPRVEGVRVHLVHLQHSAGTTPTPTSRRRRPFVAAATASLPEPMVLDLGANDGRFSRVAVDAGASLAIAVDGDHLVVDHLYRQLRSEGETRILPLVMDLSDPSPGLGWRGRERPSFVERVRPDLVLCLAVIHHLALSGTVPFPEIVAFLHDFSAPAGRRDAPPRRSDGGSAPRPQAGRRVRPLRPTARGRPRCASASTSTSRSRCPPARARSTAAALADRFAQRRGGRSANQRRQHLADRAGDHHVGQVVHRGGRPVDDHHRRALRDRQRHDVGGGEHREGGADGQQQVGGAGGRHAPARGPRPRGSDRS